MPGRSKKEKEQQTCRAVEFEFKRRYYNVLFLVYYLPYPGYPGIPPSFLPPLPPLSSPNQLTPFLSSKVEFYNSFTTSNQLVPQPTDELLGRKKRSCKLELRKVSVRTKLLNDATPLLSLFSPILSLFKSFMLCFFIFLFSRSYKFLSINISLPSFFIFLLFP